jgi:hypothetical protein
MSERLAFDFEGFAKALQKAMNQRGVSRETVAEATGLQDAAVRRAQNGLVVSLDTAWALLLWLREPHPLRFSIVVESEPEWEDPV